MADFVKAPRAAFLAALSLAFLGAPSPGRAQLNRMPDGPVACNAFARGPGGSWSVLRPATISPAGRMLRLSPGQVFLPSQLVGGVEVTAVLDRNCGN